MQQMFALENEQGAEYKGTPVHPVLFWSLLWAETQGATVEGEPDQW